MTRVIGIIREDQKKRLYHILVDEDISYSEWLRRQIDAYLAAKEPKRKRDKEKEVR
jgi:hypothetical protein